MTDFPDDQGFVDAVPATTGTEAPIEAPEQLLTSEPTEPGFPNFNDAAAAKDAADKADIRADAGYPGNPTDAEIISAARAGDASYPGEYPYAPTTADAERAALASNATFADPILGVDGKPQLDFTTFETAQAQADILGGVVVPAGVAFHVADAE